MVLTRSALEKMSSEELVSLVLEQQDTVQNTLTQLNNEMSKFNKNFEKLEAELLVSKSVNALLEKRITDLERQCWKNEQYSRRECVEITGIPEDTDPKKVCELFNKINVNLSPDDFQACHPLKSQDKNKIIVKFHKRDHSNLVLKNKSLLKTFKPTDIGLPDGIVYVNESLCRYYKYLWSKCKQLWRSREIHSFWCTNGTLKLKIEERGRIQSILHLDDLKLLFPEYNFN